MTLGRCRFVGSLSTVRGQAWPSCGPVTQGTSVDDPPGDVSPGERHPCVFSVRNGACGT
ncbi:hypothetical protein BDP55DRAFT_675205 [Colletotrichum godetiae]|uniref:Uncharacterized protein n=1 Tax=Colletotrichum godetiae TaxID=1209918 RepID=A0AAJ0AD54_9PEZI|nr:uncharacterized protein BDP55DRAFT_675205 [Colletotrichum godetiae]KAK1671704.1 hypothetical protein BDP55DRAFT_675205 [Colletotrichum godetiae]